MRMVSAAENSIENPSFGLDIQAIHKGCVRVRVRQIYILSFSQLQQFFVVVFFKYE